MRSFAPILFWLAAGTFCLAQKKEEDMGMIERMDDGRNRAMAALYSGNQGKKKVKKDPSLESSYTKQTFQSGNASPGNKANGVSPFVFDQKFTAQSFHSGRSFFGIKNPWFGDKVYDSGGTDLWSKTLALDSDKKFTTREVDSKKALLGDDKAATVETPVATTPFLAQGKSQGSVNQINDKITKEMTIEEVRTLLNKDR